MKKLTIELTDNEYLLIKENAVKWNVPIEEYLAIAGRCYIDIVRRKREVLAENYHLKKEIEAQNHCIDKYENILQKYYEYAGDLPKDY